MVYDELIGAFKSHAVEYVTTLSPSVSKYIAEYYRRYQASEKAKILWAVGEIKR